MRSETKKGPAVGVLLATAGNGVADGLDLLATDDVTVRRLLGTNRVQEGLSSQALLVRAWCVSVRGRKNQHCCNEQNVYPAKYL